MWNKYVCIYFKKPCPYLKKNNMVIFIFWKFIYSKINCWKQVLKTWSNNSPKQKNIIIYQDQFCCRFPQDHPYSLHSHLLPQTLSLLQPTTPCTHVLKKKLFRLKYKTYVINIGKIKTYQTKKFLLLSNNLSRIIIPFV